METKDDCRFIFSFQVFYRMFFLALASLGDLSHTSSWSYPIHARQWLLTMHISCIVLEGIHRKKRNIQWLMQKWETRQWGVAKIEYVCVEFP